MPNSDGTANVGDALKAIGIALIFALLIVWAGTRLHHNWLLIVVTPACTAAGGFLASKAYGKKTTMATTMRWGLFGLIAGVIWFIAS